MVQRLHLSLGGSKERERMFNRMPLNRVHLSHSGNRYKQRFLMGMLQYALSAAETPILSLTDFSPLAFVHISKKKKNTRNVKNDVSAMCRKYIKPSL